MITAWSTTVRMRKSSSMRGSLLLKNLDILSIDREQRHDPDYEAALEAGRRAREGDRPAKRGRAEKGSKKGEATQSNQPMYSPGHPITEEDFEEIIQTLGWDKLYGEFAMLSCAERLLCAFAPHLTVGEINDSLEPEKRSVYDVLIHIMRKYGAYTNTVEEMLKDIRNKHGKLGLPPSCGSGASSSSQPPMLPQLRHPSPSSQKQHHSPFSQK